MGTNGLLTDVRWEWTGTEVTTDLVAGTTVLPVLDPLSVTADEDVWIADTGPYTIADTDVDGSTFTLTSGLQVDVDSGTEVAKDIGGQPGRAWVCEVILADADSPIEVPLTIHDLSVMPEGTYDPPVVIVLSDDLGSVEDLPGSLPTIDGVYIPPDTLPPGPQGVPGPPGADGSPQYTWVKYADSPTTGMSDDPTGKAYIGLSYNHDDPTESSNYNDYAWSKIAGDPGPPAAIIDLTASSLTLIQPSGGGATTPPTAVVTGVATNTTISTWEYSVDGAAYSTTPPTGVSRAGNVVTITGATMTATSIAVRMGNGVGVTDTLTVAKVREGAAGVPGPGGPPGAPGVGVSSTAVTYQVGSSGTVAPTGAWVATPQATAPGEFLWTRTITTYTDTTTSTAYAVAAHGATGSPGNPGAPGVGITGTTVSYQVGNSGTSAPTGTWVASPPATTPGTFLWTRTITNYSDSTSSTAYSVSAHGATGSTGSPGSPGAPGVGITSTTVTYQVGSSGTSAPTGTWQSTPQATTPGTFLWTRTVTNYSDTTTSTAYSVSAHGTTGTSGTAGVGVSSTAVTYQAGSSGTAAPTGTWVSSPPATAPGQFLWTRTITTYTDTSTSTAYSVAAQGTPGNPGADAYTISQSNEAHTFPGSTGAALAGSTTTTFTALKGTGAIAASISNAAITGAPTGMTTAVSGSPGTPVVTVTVTTALVALSGVLTIPVVVDGFTFNKLFSWSVSRQGTDGTPGPPGADGTPRYTWTKYADNATGTVGFSDVPTATSKYLGMAYNQTTLVESNVPGDYQWSLIQGPAGPTGPQGTPGSATDGAAPTASVTNLTITGGIGALFVRWTPISNHDPVTYDLHISTVSGFTPDGTTLAVSTMASSHTVRVLPTAVGDPPSTALRYGSTYYARVIARDPDPGVGPTSPQAFAQMMQVTGQDVAANTITADNIMVNSLTGDLFVGNVILGSTISTGSLDADGNIVGSRIDLGPAGLGIYDSDGNLVSYFPNDPDGTARISNAHLEVLSADVADYFTMRGINNTVGASSKLTLGKGIDAPTAQPSLAFINDSVQLDTKTVITGTGAWPLGTFALDASQIRSIAWDSSANSNCWLVIQQKSAGFRQWRFNADGSLKINFISGVPWVDDFKGFFNATSCQGTLLFTTGDGNYMLYGGAQVPAAWITNPNIDPFIAWDRVNSQYMLCQQTTGPSPKAMQIRRFTASGGTLTSQGITNSPTSVGRSQRINGCYYGAADFGGNRFVTTTENASRVLVWTASTRYNANGSFAEWDAPGTVVGFGFDESGSFWSCDSNGLMTKYTNWTWTAEPVTTSVGMSAYDSQAGAPSDLANPWPGQSAGQHETSVGTLNTVTARRRSKLVITVPPTNFAGGADDADKWKVYWARTSVTPATKTDLKFVAALGSATVSAATTITADPTGVNPPGGVSGQAGASNNFPAGNPARIVSAGLTTGGTPVIDLKGDGSGIAGPFKWDKTGKDLTKNGLVVAYTSGHAFSAPTSTFTPVGSWALDPASTAPEWNGGAPSGRFTILVPGNFLCIATASFASAGTTNPTRRITAIYKNDVEFQRQDVGGPANGASPTTLQVQTVIRLTPSDTISVWVWQNSGTTASGTPNPGHMMQLIKLSD